MTERIAILNTGKGKLPRLPFTDMKNTVLGAKYDLSLVFLSPKKMQALNKERRGKNKPTNILSFPLSKTAGEIFISLAVAKKEAPSFDRKFENYLGFLFIHGLTHLKGFDHGSKMESIEQRYRKKFYI